MRGPELVAAGSTASAAPSCSDAAKQTETGLNGSYPAVGLSTSQFESAVGQLRQGTASKSQGQASPGWADGGEPDATGSDGAFPARSRSNVRSAHREASAVAGAIVGWADRDAVYRTGEDGSYPSSGCGGECSGGCGGECGGSCGGGHPQERGGGFCFECCTGEAAYAMPGLGYKDVCRCPDGSPQEYPGTDRPCCVVEPCSDDCLAKHAKYQKCIDDAFAGLMDASSIDGTSFDYDSAVLACVLDHGLSYQSECGQNPACPSVNVPPGIDGCDNMSYDTENQCCEDGKVVEKVDVWHCNRYQTGWDPFLSTGSPGALNFGHSDLVIDGQMFGFMDVTSRFAPSAEVPEGCEATGYWCNTHAEWLDYPQWFHHQAEVPDLDAEPILVEGELQYPTRMENQRPAKCTRPRTSEDR